ncbi:hypothetical protein DXG03_005932 [Asterophora parasitica]|uniref:Uncharacterized protein n=1 Tax=Asterophora parasitica TaxID=117018 RepID=A0A9P7KBA8_9AGAR|nr:hypothetical protein DXG03_005932 [Asterophora parasitica]
MSARTWTPRGASPPRDAFRASASAGLGSDSRVPSPPPSRETSALGAVSPDWDPEPPARYDSRNHERPSSSRGALGFTETRPSVAQEARTTRPLLEEQTQGNRDRHAPTATPRVGSLEGRLGDRYEGFAAPQRQPHALPMNPALHRDHNTSLTPDTNRRYSDRRSMQPGYGGSAAWADSVPPSNRAKGFHAQPVSNDQLPPASRTPRNRQYPSNYPPDESMDMDDESRYAHEDHESQHRPEMARQGGSLLARMSLNRNGDDVRNESVPQSLRDRVQVPAKRDRDMMGERYAVDDSFGGDDGDPALKKMRRKSTKPRKLKRGPS